MDSDGEIDDDLPPKKKRRTTILKGATSWLPGLGLGRGKHDAALNVAAAGILLKNSRKPSTLDFRCIGTMDEMVARKSVETLSLMGIPAMKEVCGPTASDAEATEKENEKEKEREKEQQKEKEKKLSGLGRLRKWARTEIKPEKSKKRDIGAMQKPRESMDPSYDGKFNSEHQTVVQTLICGSAPKLDWREPQVARDADWKRNWFIGID